MARKFVFRKNTSIGAADALDDSIYLTNCFVDTGDLAILRDCDNPQRIVLGRTGSGKTALLHQLQEGEENVIIIPPESLSLSYISNSNILNFFSQAGVNLDIFYKLLWRHVFTVELIKSKFQIKDDSAKMSFLDRLSTLFKSNKKKEKSINYLLKWGESFWEETEYRIKEVTTKLENELKNSIGDTIPALSLNISGASKLSEEQKAEVTQRAQSVVNRVQIRQLSDIIDLLAEDFLTDLQERYYIVIDRLDENWVEDNLRYKLIRALIETVKDFKKVRSLKIIIALRTDLIDRVFADTRGAGFQEEKYESLFLYLSWNKENLINLLDRRINYLVKDKYTNQNITLKEILPQRKIDKQVAIDYMIDRTLMRPRDLIQFFNTCIYFAEGRAVITKSALSAAEGEYSRKRLRALQDEWFADYPDLFDFVQVLKKTPKSFTLKQFSNEHLEKIAMDLVISQNEESYKGILAVYTKGYLSSRSDIEYFKRILFGIFYRVGIVGLKIETYANISWSFETLRLTISSTEINDNTRVYIHPFAWRHLGSS